MGNIIELKNISKVHGKRVKTEVLHNVNLSIGEGDFISIVGASGSGKSTLLNIMGTLDKPTTGQVYIENKRTDKMSRRSLASLRNKEIGFIFQFHYLLPEFNTLENVLMPYRINRFFYGRKSRERAEMLLDLVGLSAVKKSKVYDLSGGQQQRVAIARALMNDTKIILADEPTGNLDSSSAENIYNVFRDINRNFNTTFVIITHDERIAEKTDRRISIKDGVVTW
ncbi:lipoprotein-releasing system ATP-binding protein LolD 2 [Clostridium pasteurianum DSM 525 = ATCC 6013]|uniref:Lipoprotein-releasing system ATP-binding protein LolD 2 n=1 Tax=Clostridium pasteurianum DSM 525 = ATCC 6013 TaxID=1262449 RepID=A0A0H3J251_CLOPA|nr:ABC transporter ATP-binding protein [Clostridium pasteurianum]AJA46822.1 lipoprotein-releasing system ATP-binding protein LolD 2 [Clostridium pasteurianum DSM 525 = ATCC 6013]AJA50810.1 lipoprotein-releasing system ATP-binding protein LolD 2 [Clostridium pasteurianum DSM 525 = ATCC 6013]AOZ74215.1 lipoprotein ABC transporter ATP-binding protein [Clostridium pasteurianum DSM 525 = ATCC 6013]AOZ78013.1 lipoprotein ABC transporter ATP-binding protein [Clostridium pasteurianum]ELP58567.1 ABC tr